MYNGKKTVFPVGAPPMHRTIIDEDDDDEESSAFISRGKAAELAADLLNKITQRLEIPESHLSHMAGKHIYRV